MKTHNLGYPRIGSQRELKKACERYWQDQLSLEELLATGKRIRHSNWKLQHDAGIDLIPSNDFSYYDQVLDMTMAVGAIPTRYSELGSTTTESKYKLYFAMARGYQQDGLDITAMEMTKWFDTNYHYIVPEFTKGQAFKLSSTKIVDEYKEAKGHGFQTMPVIIGPLSYLLLGKEKEAGFNKLDLLENLLPVYFDLLNELVEAGAEWIQFDEPFLTLDLSAKARELYPNVYAEITKKFPSLRVMLATYFNGFEDNLDSIPAMPVHALHLDLVRDPGQLEGVLERIPGKVMLSLGVIDGRNTWKNDFHNSLQLIRKATDLLGEERILVAPSCSLLHVPCDLDLETNEDMLTPAIKSWLAFAKQKLQEVVNLKELTVSASQLPASEHYEKNKKAIHLRKVSPLVHNPAVKERIDNIVENDTQRVHNFDQRREAQHEHLQLPLFPTTTIGSFPQTREIRQLRSKLKKGDLTAIQYEIEIKKAIEQVIRLQEEIDLDVLVHGEFERNDMVEYFGEKLEGFAFTSNGWVQSYGSRCVKPPIIYGDVARAEPMTVKWSSFAQSLTKRAVKGMLTGPVTILQWSFVRDDQPRSKTCMQIALAIRDEVIDLEKAGIKIIQVDEPAIREGLPLRTANWKAYLDWAVTSFRLATSGVKDQTQIHTHMCYSEFNDIMDGITQMDADVITIECSRSQMELLEAFADFNYPNEIGPGVYDIHSPRVPFSSEIVALLTKVSKVIPSQQLWVNPDCGLKTRHWDETRQALLQMVDAAKQMRGAFDLSSGKQLV